MEVIERYYNSGSRAKKSELRGREEKNKDQPDKKNVQVKNVDQDERAPHRNARLLYVRRR